MDTTPVTAHMTFHVFTDNADLANDAKSRVLANLDRVWIVRDVTTRFHLAAGVHSFTVKFTAPAHEATADAPAVKDAITAGSYVAPIDSVSVWR